VRSPLRAFRRSHVALRLGVTLALALAAPGGARVPPPSPPAPHQAQAEAGPLPFGESVDVRLGAVRLLLDRRAPPLDAGDVRVRWRGREQKVLRVVGGAAASLELGLAVDVSASTAPRFAELAGAATGAARALLTAEDRLFLVAFGERAELVAAARGDVERVLAALPEGSRPERTAIFAAVGFGLETFEGADARAALVLLTDGCDMVPEEPPVAALRARSRERALPLYLLALGGVCQAAACPGGAPVCRDVPARPYRAAMVRRGRLEHLAHTTGGRVFRLGADLPLERAWATLLEELSRQWLVVFEPTSGEVSSDEVEVLRRDGRRFRRLR